MTLRAVVFDVDGVLVQSMEKHHEAYQRALGPYGIQVEREQVFANEGRRAREVLHHIAALHGVRLEGAELDAVTKVKQDAFMGFGPMPMYPGVAELVERVQGAGLRVAIVTGTARVNVEHHFGGLLRTLDAVVTADDVKRTKPDPEPYVAALTKLGLMPNEAVVVENAPLGVQSARAAGIQVIGVASTNPADVLREHGATVVVDRVADVWTVLGGWMQ